MPERHSLLLVDDHPIVRQGLTWLIDAEDDVYVCGEADTAEQAISLAESMEPVMALVDLSLQGRPSVELIRTLRTIRPQMRVLVLSMHDESQWAARALEAGASGYVMKQDSPRILIHRIRQALRGETAVSESIASDLLKRLTWDRKTQGTEVEPLGERELQVLRLLGQGHSNPQIAASLQISIKTVSAHREHIKQKLGLRSAAELMRYAVLDNEKKNN